MVNDFAVQTLEPNSAEESVELAHRVGWHDAVSDWRVLHACGTVLGVRAPGGTLIAQGALVDFGSVGTVAKMIVHPEFQRHGLGRRILERLLFEADARSLGLLGLAATDFGRPLYEQYGFARTGDIVVLMGVPRIDSSVSAEVLTDIEAATRFDQRHLSCSRDAMLRARFAEASSRFALWEPGSQLRGYALSSAQAQHQLLGPVVATSEADARSLSMAAFAANAGRSVRVDVPSERSEFRKWLRDLGLRELGSRAEMARGGTRLPWQAPERFALSTQAFG